MSRGQAVGIHGEAHRAARFAPFKTSFDKYFVQAFFFGLFFHQTGAWDNQYALYIVRFFTAFGDGGGFAQIFDAAVGARTDKDDIDRDFVQWRTGFQAHVFEGAFHAAAFDRIGFFGWIRHFATDVQNHFRRCSPSYLRLDVFGFEVVFFIEYGAFVRHQRAPVFDGFVPRFAFRCERFAFYIVDGGLIDGNHA